MKMSSCAHKRFLGAALFSTLFAACGGRGYRVPEPVQGVKYNQISAVEYKKVVSQAIKADYASMMHGLAPQYEVTDVIGCINYDKNQVPKNILLTKRIQNNKGNMFFVARLKKGAPDFQKYAMRRKDLKESAERKNKK